MITNSWKMALKFVFITAHLQVIQNKCSFALFCGE